VTARTNGTCIKTADLLRALEAWGHKAQVIAIQRPSEPSKVSPSENGE